MRSRRISPTTRTVTLGAMGLVAGLTMTIALVVAVRGTYSVARQNTDRAVPAQIALRETWAAATAGQEALLEVLRTEDPATKSAGLAAAQASSQGQNSAWAAYIEHALGRPGEADLQHSYEVAAAQSVKLSAALLGTPPADPTFATKLAGERREAADIVTAIASLESTIYDPVVQSNAASTASGINGARNVAYLAYGVLALIFAVVGGALMRGSSRDERGVQADATAMKAAAEFAKLETTLQRALDMERTEEAAYDVMAQALTMVAPEVPSELLLADSSHAHFRQVFSTDPGADAGCHVSAPEECPATTSGQTQFFADTAYLDTCPYLRNRDDRVWATCVPISIAGRATGVIHAQRAVEFHRGDTTPAWELIGRKAGERIGMLRAFARSETQADTDPLTGLLNRRSLEERTRDLLESGLPFVVAYGDLDQFKLLNDVHGHDAGDRALRLFARVLRDSVRPNDIPSALRRRGIRHRAPRLFDRQRARRRRTHPVSTRRRAHERYPPSIHCQLRHRRVGDGRGVATNARRRRSGLTRRQARGPRPGRGRGRGAVRRRHDGVLDRLGMTGMPTPATASGARSKRYTVQSKGR